LHDALTAVLSSPVFSALEYSWLTLHYPAFRKQENVMSDTNEAVKTYNPFELFQAHEGPVPESFKQRRRVSHALKELTEKLIRIEADDDRLAAWAERLEVVLAEASLCARRDTKDANRKLFSGQATAEDVFHMMDYNPVGGSSNPIAPELIWVKHSAEGVEAHARLGMAYQGPPGRVHGGVISWMLDAVLSRAMHAALRIGMTGNLNVHYLAGTPLYETLSLRAHIVRQDGRKTFVEGGIWMDDKQTVAADGVWLKPKNLSGL
jgi:acyl-coenzyme A thioesterase PaaI-like protein